MLRNRKTIAVLISTVIGIAIGTALGYGPLLKYKSMGVIHMEMTTSEYKRIAELANDAQMLREFAATTPPNDIASNGVDKLIRSIVSSDWQAPVPKISKLDARELPDLIIQMEQERQRDRDRDRDRDRRNVDDGEALTVPPSYLGIRLSAQASTPTEAVRLATWLGSYFKDIATREALRDQVFRWAAKSQEFSDRANERKLKYQFAIEQAKLRALAFKRVVAEYPEAGRRETSQVVELRKDNEKFISPLSQLVGAESEIIDNQEKLKKLDREMSQEALRRSMMVDIEKAIVNTSSGLDSAAKLLAVIATYSKDAKTEAEREKIASMTADISHIRARFQAQAQFLAKPSMPGYPEQPVPIVIAIAGALLAALLSVAILWRNNLISFLSSGNLSNKTKN